MRVSVVVPTFNRAGLLRETIPALMGQRVSATTGYEVIFVSNGSTDDSVRVLAAAQERFAGRLRYFHIDPTGGPAAPRNVGIRAAEGEVIVILDDDVVPHDDLVEQHAAYHRRHAEPYDVAIGDAYVPDRLLDDPMTVFHMYPYHELRGQDLLSYTKFWTCNLSIKRDFMLEFGMFDESFLFNEDVVCGLKLSKSGMHLRFWPQARAEHLHKLAPEDLRARALHIGRWIAETVRRYAEPELFEYYGVLTPKQGWFPFLRRVGKRAAFRLVDNPATHGMLRLLGAENGRRSRVSDAYYYLILRRNILAGYREAPRDAERALQQHRPEE